jgi:membrane dipeptidase
VFTEIPDIDLPEITKFNPEKLKNGSIHSYSNKSKIEAISPPPNKAKNKRIVAIVSGLMLLLVLAAGIPIGLQLRSSSLLEKRLSFVR